MIDPLDGLKMLIAEDNSALRQGLVRLFGGYGASCIEVEDGFQALEAFRSSEIDFCLVDVTMEGFSGLELCAQIRSEAPGMPVLILSARREPADRIKGLEIGADDYVIKPFDSDELVARVRTIMRRSTLKQANAPLAWIQMKDIQLCPERFCALRDGREIALSKREVRLLQLLFINANRVTTRDELIDFGWGADHAPNSRSLDQAIVVLRRKIERDPVNPAIIETVRGGGYKFRK